MATATLHFLPQTNFTRLQTPRRLALSKRKLSLPSLRQSHIFPPLKTNHNARCTISSAYVTGPASDPVFSESDPRIDDSDSRSENIRPPNLITWGLLWRLLLKHKLRLCISILTLVGCTSCTLSMPIFSGANHSSGSVNKLLFVLINFMNTDDVYTLKFELLL